MKTTYTAPSSTLTIEHDASEVQQAVALLTSLGVMRGLGTATTIYDREEADEPDLADALTTTGPIGG